MNVNLFCQKSLLRESVFDLLVTLRRQPPGSNYYFFFPRVTQNEGRVYCLVCSVHASFTKINSFF